MRKASDYVAEGRSDPLSPEQLEQHPYDFVSLPEKPNKGYAVGHDAYPQGRLTGRLNLVYETLTPLHVGSGVFETAAECGLGNRPVPVRGIVRRRGKPVLPGSGWKGAVRARFEAVTGSRLGLVDTFAKEPASKVPQALKDLPQAKHKVSIDDSRVRKTLRPLGNFGSGDDLTSLPPAGALFGCMGYRGRIHPGDGVIHGPAATEPLQVAPLDSPMMHRLAKPGAASKAGHSSIRISKVEGRKFYYDGPIVSSRQNPQGSGTGRHELIDYVPPGSTITLDVHLESLTPAELGALLVAAGYGAGVGVMRFGGYKSVGLGKVELRTVTAEVRRGSTTSSWRREPAAPYDLAGAVEEAKQQGLIDLDALQELDLITHRQRPACRRMG